ncbi:hypothetical protein [Terribacillus saccharophilus]|uniref:DUF4064 domain-containing protein n=1 Tax=Terribacillus saccharophilus TaxID=361277 RepID=A0ABX4H1K4_9BACI|nr:hypothetical protein [Terribacillus saccharophilus]PAD36663.1 hypothetical protein CHH56_02125 [Terribacillus saccharophilus]PAD97645.1 hypothetical protein CHH50_02830 [Terribacillus saccharophilus]PAE01027.1 hypothetical protein CHH48_02825 [Terribacillus saccharophilus]
MKNVALIGGIIGLLFSIIAQLFAVIDDSYTFGNIGFLGMISGITAIVCSLILNKRPLLAGWLLILATATGVYALAGLYLIPGTMTLIAGINTLGRRNENGTSRRT